MENKVNCHKCNVFIANPFTGKFPNLVGDKRIIEFLDKENDCYKRIVAIFCSDECVNIHDLTHHFPGSYYN